MPFVAGIWFSSAAHFQMVICRNENLIKHAAEVALNNLTEGGSVSKRRSGREEQEEPQFSNVIAVRWFILRLGFWSILFWVNVSAIFPSCLLTKFHGLFYPPAQCSRHPGQKGFSNSSPQRKRWPWKWNRIFHLTVNKAKQNWNSRLLKLVKHLPVIQKMDQSFVVDVSL